MREKTLMNFKSGKMPTLLATDIAARGIHVNNIEYVINYDFPGSLDQVRLLIVLYACTCCSILMYVSHDNVAVHTQMWPSWTRSKFACDCL